MVLPTFERSRSRAFGVQGFVIGLTLAFVLACEPTLQVGTYQCHSEAPSEPTPDEVAPFPWSSGFEREFCDYRVNFGFCYAAPGASYEIVTSPVRSGRYAAAFSIDTADPEAQQTRCVRQGVLPSAAYYGAWYFIPAVSGMENNWNLMHFRGGGPEPSHGLWDVSLSSTASGQLRLFVFDFLHATIVSDPESTPIPIGAWFHLQFYWRRAKDETGEVAVYQDGRLVHRLTGLITDDSEWGQWYVGNLANALVPSTSTLYVDDVSIAEAL